MGEGHPDHGQAVQRGGGCGRDRAAGHPVKITKFTADTDKILKDIETASEGALNATQVRLKSMVKEIIQMRVALLERPKSADYERFRASIRREFLDKTLAVLNDFLDLKLFEEVKRALQKALK